jgi:hypothetical protein
MIVIRATVLTNEHFKSSIEIINLIDTFSKNQAISTNGNIRTASSAGSDYGGTRYICKNSYIDLVYEETDSHFFGKLIIACDNNYILRNLLCCTMILHKRKKMK